MVGVYTDVVCQIKNDYFLQKIRRFSTISGKALGEIHKTNLPRVQLDKGLALTSDFNVD